MQDSKGETRGEEPCTKLRSSPAYKAPSLKLRRGHRLSVSRFATAGCAGASRTGNVNRRAGTQTVAGKSCRRRPGTAELAGCSVRGVTPAMVRVRWWLVYKVTGGGKTYHGSVEEVRQTLRKRQTK